MIRTAPPQAGQVSMSIPKPPLTRCAQVIAAWSIRASAIGDCRSGGWCSLSARSRPVGVGSNYHPDWQQSVISGVLCCAAIDRLLHFPSVAFCCVDESILSTGMPQDLLRGSGLLATRMSRSRGPLPKKQIRPAHTNSLGNKGVSG
jgi:hypothetical protein